MILNDTSFAALGSLRSSGLNKETASDILPKLATGLRPNVINLMKDKNMDRSSSPRLTTASPNLKVLASPLSLS